MRNYFFLLIVFFVLSCGSSKETTSVKDEKKKEATIPTPAVYHGTYDRKNDLVHTKIEAKIDWTKKQLYGKATITLHPHFYPTDSLILTARGMDLHEVSLLGTDGTRKKIEFTYDDRFFLKIKLDRIYSKEESYRIFIDYTSKPEELAAGGSAAITRDKGLYFINSDLSNPEKPRQVWTQGETESNSSWFPTIEDPQQKMTQEIYLTVDSGMTTVSNGLLISSVNNNDGSKTDYWKQSLPAAPYLTMIAVSDFALVRDKWRNIEVQYYLDKDYAQYAPMIFGRTPEMMEFFSGITGVDYVWEKYAQVVVHDYVSGAMENTTAVIHGTNMLEDSGEYADFDYEDYISHELFHHWFGDLVTCESWSNITLNESFANYGQYLWKEYKFGRDEADLLAQNDQAVYILVSKTDDPALVRYDYSNREDVYDVVSYNKGGRILHMLRKYIGDDAFFASLKLYLEANKFGAAEVHDFRLALEKVTGQDMNWFFNQWYFQAGHPVIEITYHWDDSTKIQTVTVQQKQDFEKNPLYTIPLRTDVYIEGKIEHKNILIKNAKETFEWKFPSRPDLINVDGERMLLAEKKDYKTKENLVFQFYHAPLYLDRFEALTKTGADYEAGSPQGKMMEDGLKDKYWNIRLQALKNIGVQVKANMERLKPVLISMATSDSMAPVRAQAIKTLGKYFKEDSLVTVVIETGIADISYDVQATSFKVIAETNKDKAAVIASRLERSRGEEILSAIGNFYEDEARSDKNDFYLSALKRLRGYSRGSFADVYGKYLKKADKNVWEKGIQQLEQSAGYSEGSARNMIINTLGDLSNSLTTKINDAKAHVEELKKNDGSSNEIGLANREIEELQVRQNDLKARIDKLLKKNEAAE